MKFEDVLTLARAGYTADQIAKFAPLADKMEQPAPQGNPAPAAQPQQAPALGMMYAGVQGQQAQPAPGVENPVKSVENSAILAELQKLTSAVQANGVLRSEQPPAPSEEEVLASILFPTKPADKE